MKPRKWISGRISRRGFLTALVLGVLTASTVVVAGKVAQARNNAPTQAVVSTANVRVAEAEAGNLLADAVRAAAGVEVAFVPAFAFKPGASVPRPASADQAAGLVDPPTDTIVILNLTGKQIRAALERSVSYAPQPSAGFLQVSGIRFAFDTRKDTPGRVSNIQVGTQPLDDNKTYKVATTKPLGNGQQGYQQIWNRQSIASDTGKTLADALNEMARSGPLSPSIDNRITQAGR